MKHLFITLLISFSGVVNISAQQITTLWPYIYPEFKEGTVFMADQEKLTSMLNIHLKEGRLHFIDRGIIKEVLNKDIVLVVIDNDNYMVVDGRVMKVMGSEKRGFISTLVLADFDKLFDTGGAYGASSSSSATMKLTSIEIGGLNITNHMQLKENRADGIPLPIKQNHFLVTKGKIYPATRRGILSKLDKEQAKEFKQFLKGKDVNWSEPQSLMELLDFFNN